MKILFWFGLIYTISIPPLVLYYIQNETYAWISLMVGVFLTLISRFNDFAEFSLGPIKARMTEKLKENEKSLEHLREIGTLLSSSILTDIMASNFWGGTTLRNKVELHDKIIKTLRQIGVDENRIAQAECDWRKGVCIIYYNALKWRIKQQPDSHHVNTKADEENQRAGHELDILLDFDNWVVPSPEKISAVLDKYKVKTTDDISKILEDYFWFVKNNEIRNIELIDDK